MKALLRFDIALFLLINLVLFNVQLHEYYNYTAVIGNDRACMSHHQGIGCASYSSW